MTLDPRRPVDDLRLLSDRLRAIEDRLDRLAAPSGTQTARALAQLAIFARSAAATSASGLSRSSNGTTTDLTALPTLSITLDRAANVLVTGSALLVGDTGAAAASPNLTALVSWQTNVAPLVGLCTLDYRNRGFVDSTNSGYAGGSALSSSQLIAAPAGTLEITALNASITFAGGGGFQGITLAPITLSALVLPA